MSPEDLEKAGRQWEEGVGAGSTDLEPSMRGMSGQGTDVPWHTVGREEHRGSPGPDTERWAEDRPAKEWGLENYRGDSHVQGDGGLPGVGVSLWEQHQGRGGAATQEWGVSVVFYFSLAKLICLDAGMKLTDHFI